MGNKTSGFFRKASKPIRNYNIESRVDKILAKDKPTPAPRHPVPEAIRKSTQDNPELNKALFEADTDLLNRLKQVYVTSQDPLEIEKKRPTSSSRPMPVSREHFEENVFGYYEPKIVPYGKITLKDALYYISKHQENPEDWTPQRIAEECKLEVFKTEQMLKYYFAFTLVVPSSTEKKPIYDDRIESLGARTTLHLPSPKTRDENKLNVASD